MKNTYKEGFYWVKSRGRGVCKAWLSKSQAKALAEICLQGKLEIEGIALVTEFNESTGI